MKPFAEEFELTADLFGVATVLTACGIETVYSLVLVIFIKTVATVLTACGIETIDWYCYLLRWKGCNSAYRLRY